MRESGSSPELGGVLRAAGAAAPCEAFSARDHGILLTADTANLHNCFAQGRLQILMAHVFVSVDLLKTFAHNSGWKIYKRADLNERNPKEPIKVKEKQKELI